MKCASFIVVPLAMVLAPPCAANPSTWAPGTDGTVPAEGFLVDTSTRPEVLSFFNAVYLASEGAGSRLEWSGNYNVSLGPFRAGETSAAFQNDVRRRVNFYRALAGMPATVTFDRDLALNAAAGPQIPAGTTKHSACMAAAFMNAVEEAILYYEGYWFELSHDPLVQNFSQWSPEAWNGSHHSCLAVGYFGPTAIDEYILDSGEDDTDLLFRNASVGHRRWLLYSRARDMATGDVPGGYFWDGRRQLPVQAANAVYVVGSTATGPVQFVPWPGAGCFPAKLTPDRWSLSYPGALFANASVSMTGPSGPVPLTVISRTNQSAGDNTIVWTPQGLPSPGAMTADVTYSLAVSGIGGIGVPSSHTWSVTLFDQDSAGIVQSISGPASPPVSGAQYTCTPVPGAERYEFNLSEPGPVFDYLQGAEDSESADIEAMTTGSYDLRLGRIQEGDVLFIPHSGSKAFHLAFPLTEVDQGFGVTPDLVPSAGSRFEYYQCFRWLFTDDQLVVEISSDGGVKWSEIDSRSGAYVYVDGGSYTASQWDRTNSQNHAPRWILRSVDLTPWAGKPVRFRFMLRGYGDAFEGEDTRHGVFIDSLTVTGVRRLQPVASLASSAPSLLVPGPAVPAQAGREYFLRSAPVVSGRRMGYSDPFSLTPSALSGYDAWVAQNYPSLTGGPWGDDDGDGSPNIIEYVFRGVPTDAGRGPELPPPVANGGDLVLTFNTPAASGVRIEAEWSRDLRSWQGLADSGGAGQHSFKLPVAGNRAGYVRFRVSLAP